MRAWIWLGAVVMTVGFMGCGGSGNGTDGGEDGGSDCGNEIVEADEQCDDGADNSDTVADACRVDCTTATCGDGVVDTGEECDGTDQCENCVSVAVCGDGIVGGSEECDGGDDCNGPDDLNPCEFKVTAFRISRLTLSDPAPGVLIVANPLINDAIVMDEDEDGALDLNLMMLAKPLNQTADGGKSLKFVTGDCTAPLDETISCTAAEGAPVADLTLENEDSTDCFVPDNSVIYSSGGICVDPDANSASACPFETLTDDMCPPAPGVDFGSLAPGDDGCFHTEPVDFTLSLGTLAIPLQAAEFAAQYDGDPATSLFGVLRGFLSAAAADATRIPGSVSTLGGQPISFLYVADVLDVGPDGTTLGWWVHVIVEAERVIWQGAETCGDGTLDEGETCDPGIASGEEGACITLAECEATATETCEQATLVNGDPCNATCAVAVIGADDAISDGCCGKDVVEGWTDTTIDDPDCPDDFSMDVTFCGGI